MSELGADRLSEEDRRARRGGFGGTAETYDRVRPGYPTAMFDAIAEYGRLPPQPQVLEIGAGTGKATVELVERGWRTIAIELDPAMAAVLERRLGDRAAVRVGAFEDGTEVAAFDLVVCATAFHWLDPGRRVDLVANALRPGGCAAIVWTRHVRGGTQDFFDAAQGCYATWTDADPAMRLPAEEGLEPRVGEFAASPRFEDVRSARFAAESAYSTEDYLDLIGTYSETIALDSGRRAALLGCVASLAERDFGGRVVKRYLFDLVLARRR